MPNLAAYLAKPNGLLSLQTHTKVSMMESALFTTLSLATMVMMHDELLWASTWLYIATANSTFRDYINEEAICGTASEFRWDLKYARAQLLLTQERKDGETYSP